MSGCKGRKGGNKEPPAKSGTRVDDRGIATANIRDDEATGHIDGAKHNTGVRAGCNLCEDAEHVEARCRIEGEAGMGWIYDMLGLSGEWDSESTVRRVCIGLLLLLILLRVEFKGSVGHVYVMNGMVFLRLFAVGDDEDGGREKVRKRLTHDLGRSCDLGGGKRVSGNEGIYLKWSPWRRRRKQQPGTRD